MEKLVRFPFIMLLVIFTAITACTKQNETATVSADSEINSLAEKAVNSLDLQEVYSGNTETGFYMDNEGVPADFLVEEGDMEGNDTLRAGIRKHSFIACLRSLDLEQKQVREIKGSIKSYRECKETAMKRAKAIYRELREKYKEKYNKIYTAFKNGTITRDKFNSLVAELKTEFQRELRSLQLKEKLDDAFRNCFRILLKDLHSILTERQWKAFAECYKR